MGSRGSVIPFFLSLAEAGRKLPVTDVRMTRFMITLERAVELVWHALDDTVGGEIYVKKIPSMKLTDIARAIVPDAEFEIIGIRPGEKLHEQMIGHEDSAYTFEYESYFKILPSIHSWGEDKNRIKTGRKVPEGFSYTSDRNSEWMDAQALRDWIAANRAKIGTI
jgi:FlaA1/EpsC-like NDP-sugar epimerase